MWSADEGHLQSVEVELLCPSALIRFVSAHGPSTKVFDKLCASTNALPSTAVAGATDVGDWAEATCNVFKMHTAGFLIL